MYLVVSKYFLRDVYEYSYQKNLTVFVYNKNWVIADKLSVLFSSLPEILPAFVSKKHMVLLVVHTARWNVGTVPNYLPVYHQLVNDEFYELNCLFCCSWWQNHTYLRLQHKKTNFNSVQTKGRIPGEHSYNVCIVFMILIILIMYFT